MPPINWDSVFETVVTTFATWALIAGVYIGTKLSISVIRKKKRVPATVLEKIWIYACYLAICLFIGLMAGDRLGTHREGGDDYTDPGEVVVDYVASSKAKWTYGTKVFVILFTTSAVGITAGFREDKKLTVKEREQLEYEIDKNSAKDQW